MTRMASFHRFRAVLNCCTLALLVLTAFALRPAIAGERRFTAALEGRVVIGDQVFSGARIGVTVDSRRQLLAIDVDGRRVALALACCTDSIRPGARIEFVFAREADGALRLVGLDSRAAAPGAEAAERRNRLLAFVAVHPVAPDSAAVVAAVHRP